MAVITRFAPSPTGHLHLGHAYSALLNHQYARAYDGRFLLRIEDIDKGRCRSEFEDGIYNDLTWLGLDWDEEPIKQSNRMDVYAQRLTELENRELIYRCFKTRKDIEGTMSAPHGPTVDAFRGTRLSEKEEQDKIAQGLPYAWRLSLDALDIAWSDLFFTEKTDDGLVERAVDVAHFGDIVLGRKDSGTSYHLASVLDDASSGVTHVIRGEDLCEAAGIHTLLQVLFDLPRPIYRHHPLICDKSGKRLSKRDKSVTIKSMRDAGFGPDHVIAQFSDLLLMK